MATLDEIRRAGLEVSADPLPSETEEASSGGAVLANFLTGLSQWKVKGEEEASRTAKLKQEQYDFYNTLRKNGFSPEEATTKVNSVYNKNQGLLPRIFAKQDAAAKKFQQPSGQDTFSREEEERTTKLAKTQAETSKIKAETKRFEKQGTYTDAQLREQSIAKKQALQMIQSGKYYTQAGDQLDIADADEAAARVAKIKGVDPDDPEIKKAIKQKFVPNFNPDLYDFVQGLRDKGHSDEEIAKDLKDKNINPEDYLA